MRVFQLSLLTIENDKELCVRMCLSFFAPTIENDEKLCVRVSFSFSPGKLKMERNLYSVVFEFYVRINDSAAKFCVCVCFSFLS